MKPNQSLWLARGWVKLPEPTRTGRLRGLKEWSRQHRKGREHRAEYMREYMRRYRQKPRLQTIPWDIAQQTTKE